MTLLLLSLTEAPVLNEFARPPEVTADTPVILLCAASNREVMEAIVGDYHQVSNDRIELRFGSSQTLLSDLEASGSGDLYLPADESYLSDAAKKREISEIRPIARMKVVLAVHAENPLGIKSFRDLLRDDVRLIQANPELSAVGRLTKKALTEDGKWEDLSQATIAFVSSVTEAANSIAIGAGDATIIYDTTVLKMPELTVVPIPEFESLYANVSIGVTTFSSNHESQTTEFLQFLSSPNGGWARFEEFGYSKLPEFYWETSYDQ